MTSPTKAKPVANRSSDTKQGEGWWMASDRRWYPPELHPSYKKPEAGATPDATGPAVAAGAPAASAASKPATAKATPTAASAKSPQAAAAKADTKPAGDQIQIKQATPTPRAAPATAAPAATAAQTNFQTPPAAPTRAPAHASSGATGETAVVEEENSRTPNFVAGIFAGVGALLAMLGSLLSWATNTGPAVDGGTFDVSFSGFDSSGQGALILAVLMLVFAGLLVLGVRPGWIFGLLAFVCGACIIAVVLYSYLDITGKASDGWAREVADRSGVPFNDVVAAGIGLKSSIGLWATGLGGLLGLLTPPFLRRDVVEEEAV